MNSNSLLNFTVSLNINLKNNSNHSYIENIIYDSGNNCNATNIYNDFELEGINNYIKKNNKIIILDFDNKLSLCAFINFIKNIKGTIIEYIYESNDIIYASRKYLNSIDTTMYNKRDIENRIEKNRLKEEYKDIYNYL
jgi:hypothetical protein